MRHAARQVFRVVPTAKQLLAKVVVDARLDRANILLLHENAATGKVPLALINPAVDIAEQGPQKPRAIENDDGMKTTWMTFNSN